MGMPATPPPLMSVEEFFALPEDNTRRHELLEGTYVVSPLPSLRHQRAVMALYERLKPALEGRRDLELFAVPGEIVLDPRSVVEPDLFAISRPASATMQWRDVGLPHLAVEILSRSTASRDRGIKRRLYQRAGVPEYWIVDLDSRLVERWRPGDERPEVLTDSIGWQPPGAGTSVEVALPDFFAAVLD